MHKRNIWDNDETKELLRIMVEQNSIKNFGEKVLKNVEVYKNIEMELTKRGFPSKDHRQIENRWKNLKKAYVKVKKRNEIGNKNIFSPFFNELNDMLVGELPVIEVNNGTDIDTSKNIDTNDDDNGSFMEPFQSLFLPISSSSSTSIKENEKLEISQSRTSPISTSILETENDLLEKELLDRESCSKSNDMLSKRNVWEYKETKVLLTIMLEQNSVKQFDRKPYRNVQIYKQIEAELKRRGFLNKDEKQIENRWKNLKKAYVKVKKINNQSGNERNLCPFYGELDSMLDCRISNSATNTTFKNNTKEENHNRVSHPFQGLSLPVAPSSITEKHDSSKFENEISTINDDFQERGKQCGDSKGIKSNVWESDETKELLRIMVEQNSIKNCDRKPYETSQIYKKIEDELKKRGFLNKNEKQIESRWNVLKKAYIKVKKINNKTGIERSLCPFFDELNHMLSDQLINLNSNSIDTSKSINIKKDNDISLLLPFKKLSSSSSDPPKSEELSNSDTKEKIEEGFKFCKKLSYPVPSSSIMEEKNFNSDTSTSATASVSVKEVGRRNRNQMKEIYRNRKSTKKQGVKRTLSQEKLIKIFFENQKQLIDYEYNLHLKKEEEFEKKFIESTKIMLENNTKSFLHGLQSILQNNLNTKTSDIRDYINSFSAID